MAGDQGDKTPQKDLEESLQSFGRRFRNNKKKLQAHIDWGYGEPFKPVWENIFYWHPRESLEALSRALLPNTPCFIVF
ncbi:MAG: hypothetical protein RQ885_02195 [Desulfurococcales archaeon]|nr:hypothetical protein [Desulfurococcales archaeon]